MKDLLSCAWREIRRRKGRASANMLGFALAVAMMVVLVTLLQFARAAESAILASTGTHFVAFSPAKNACLDPACKNRPLDPDEGFVADTVTAKPISAALVEQVKKSPAVKDASPYLMFKFKDPRDGHTFNVGGFDPANEVAVSTTCCAATDVVSGRFLTPTDREAVMLEEAYAKAWKIGVGEQVTIAGSVFTVAGIVNSGIRPGKSDMYVPFAVAKDLVNRRLDIPLADEINIILVEVENSRLQKEAMETVKALMGEGVVSSYNCYQPAAQVMGINERSVWLLIVLAGLAAMALSLKTQYGAVIERRHDIGILKAIGWTNREVVAQILAESVLQSAAGGILGCLAALAILLLVPIKGLSGITTPNEIAISWYVPLLGLGLALAGGIVAGFLPALGTARQSPAEALRRI